MSIFSTQSLNPVAISELQPPSITLTKKLTSVFSTRVVPFNSSESTPPSTKKRKFTSINSKNSVNKMSSGSDEDPLFSSRFESIETAINELLRIKNKGNKAEAEDCFFSLFERINRSRELIGKKTIHDEKWDRILADVKTFYNPDEEQQPLLKKRKTSSSSTSSSTDLSSTSSNSVPTSAPKKIFRSKDGDEDFEPEDSSSTDEELSTSDMDDDFSDDDDFTYSLKQEKRIPDKGEPSRKKRKISTRSSTRSNFTSSSTAFFSNSSGSDSVKNSKAISFASISSSGSDKATDPVTSESGSDSSDDDDSDEDFPSPNLGTDDLRTNRLTRSSSNSISTSAQASSPSCSGNSTILDDSRSSESPSALLLSSSKAQPQTPKLSIDKQKEIKNKLLEAIGKYQRLFASCKKQDRVERSFLEDVKQRLDEAIELIQEKSDHLTDSALSTEKAIIEENLRKLQEISGIFKRIL